jgi:hypothetical protein
MYGRVYALLSLAVDAIAELAESPLVATHGERNELVGSLVQSQVNAAASGAGHCPLDGFTPSLVLCRVVVARGRAWAGHYYNPLIFDS